MATSLARYDLHPVGPQPQSFPGPSQVLELRRGDSAEPRRFELLARRAPEGVELVCFLLPAPPGLEVEVSAGDVRLVRRVPADGRLTIDGLPSECQHLKVVVRGGGLPALAFLKLPVE